MKAKLLLMIFYFCFSALQFAQKLSEIEKLRWLEEVWQCAELPQNFERWSWQDGSLKGSGYKLVSGKEEVFEWLEITLSSGKLVYRVQIPKTANRVDFIMERKGTKYVFINSQNDYPQVITYQRINTKKYKVVMSMLRSDGKNAPTLLTFTEVKAKSWQFN